MDFVIDYLLLSVNEYSWRIGIATEMTNPLYLSKGHSFDRIIEWEVTVPRFRLTSAQKRKRTIPLHFQVKNNSDKRLTVRIQITSLSKLLRFQSVSLKVIGRNRVSEESATLAQVKKERLSPKQARRFKFLVYYYPHFTPQPVSQIRLEYTVAAFEEDGKIVTHSDVYQILIPMAKMQ